MNFVNFRSTVGVTGKVGSVLTIEMKLVSKHPTVLDLNSDIAESSFRCRRFLVTKIKGKRQKTLGSRIFGQNASYSLQAIHAAPIPPSDWPKRHHDDF